MNFNQLSIFISIYRNMSFTKASGELGISQPSISEQMKNLEADLGCKLFERLGRTIKPTKEARLMYPRAINIIEETDKLKEIVTESRAEISGRLTIGASTIPGTYMLPGFIAAFRKKHPMVTFDVHIGDSRQITDMLLKHDILIGITGAVMEADRLDHFPCCDDELVLAAPPGLIGKDTITAAELADIPFVLRAEGSGTKRIMEDHMKKSGLNIKGLSIAALLNSNDAVKEALKAGLGASILSRIAIKEELQAGTLKETRIKGLKMMRKFNLVTHKRRILPAPYQALALEIKSCKK